VPDQPNRSPGRPRASSQAEIEGTAIHLFLAHGYDEVTVGQIAAACGVGRATFFRYFDSKAHVVFYTFDAVLESMWTILRAAGPRRAADQAIADCVIESTRQAVANAIWLDRFVLLDTSPGLRAGAAEHWSLWVRVLSDYLNQRPGARAGTEIPHAAFAAAVREIYIEFSRHPANDQNDPERFIRELDATLRPLCRTLAPLLTARPPS